MQMRRRFFTRFSSPISTEHVSLICAAAIMTFIDTEGPDAFWHLWPVIRGSSCVLIEATSFRSVRLLFRLGTQKLGPGGRRSADDHTG